MSKWSKELNEYITNAIDDPHLRVILRKIIKRIEYVQRTVPVEEDDFY